MHLFEQGLDGSRYGYELRSGAGVTARWVPRDHELVGAAGTLLTSFWLVLLLEVDVILMSLIVISVVLAVSACSIKERADD